MKEFKTITYEDIKNIKYILCDIDDTITTEGKLTAQAYSALWKLNDAGIRVVPVTGRPAGWCDMIIRQWPVSGVVGENGAFAYYPTKNGIELITHPSVATGDIQKRLEKVKEACLNTVKGCRVSKDQFSRKYDVAIDFNEDEPKLGFEAAEKIKDVCIKLGAVAKVSSIHVNAWYGDYTKVDMAKLFLKEIYEVENPQECCMFFGDSPNDEPMFEFFKHSCAVANIKPFVSSLQHLPSYIAEFESGKGFTHCVNHLLTLI